MLPSPGSRLSRHRFGPVQASPAACLREPRRPLGVKQAVPYGARSDTPPLSARLDVYFQVQTALILPGHVRLPRKQSKHKLSQAISLLPWRARATEVRDCRIHHLYSRMQLIRHSPQSISHISLHVAARRPDSPFVLSFAICSS